MLGHADRRSVPSPTDLRGAPQTTVTMNRTVKDATIKTFHYPDPEALRAHVLAFVTAYNVSAV